MNRTYVIVSPVKNEEHIIEETLRSVTNQTILPAEWIIVDDNSTDRTADIVGAWARKHSWIRTISRKGGIQGYGHGVISSFLEGLQTCTIKDYDFVVKLDGDLSFENTYFESLLARFEDDPKLGIASGKTYVPQRDAWVLDPCPDDHTRGPIKTYRMACYRDIGGPVPALGWDAIDSLAAQMKGWTTRSFADLKVLHHRRIGSRRPGLYRNFFIEGERMNYLGYHPLFLFAKAIRKVFSRPFLIGAVVYLAGFAKAYLCGDERMPDKEMIKFLRGKQLSRMGLRPR